MTMRRIDKHVGVRDFRSEYASNGTATAGGAGDATEVDGAWVDRKPATLGAYHTAKLVISYTTTLAAAATLTFAANIQDATDDSGTGAADFGSALTATTVATGPSGGGTVKGTIEMDFDISNAREFLRSQITPNLSAANTDTCSWQAAWVFGGSDRSGASKSLIAA